MAVTAETVEKGPQESVSQSEGVSGSDWFRRDIQGGEPLGDQATEASSESTDQAASTETEQTGDQSQQASGSESSDTDSQNEQRTFTVTTEQLERAFNQRLQSHLTSDDYKRQKQSDIDKAVAAYNKKLKRDKVEALQDENPYAYVEAKKELEAEEKAEQERGNIDEVQYKATEIGMRQTAALFDTEIMAPVLAAVPLPLRTTLEQVRGKGMAPFDERKALVSEAVKLIRQDEAEKTERRLRNNQAFIKQLLRDNSEDEEEVDVAVGSIAPLLHTGSESEVMNDWIRGATGRGTRRR